MADPGPGGRHHAGDRAADLDPDLAAALPRPDARGVAPLSARCPAAVNARVPARWRAAALGRGWLIFVIANLEIVTIAGLSARNLLGLAAIHAMVLGLRLAIGSLWLFVLIGIPVVIWRLATTRRAVRQSKSRRWESFGFRHWYCSLPPSRVPLCCRA